MFPGLKLSRALPEGGQNPLLHSKDPLKCTLILGWAQESTSPALPSFRSLDGVLPPGADRLH